MTRRLFGTVLSLLLLVPCHAIGQDKAPPVMDSKDAKSETPAWVSAEAAATSGGEVNWSLLGDQAHRAYLDLLESTPPITFRTPGDETTKEYDPDYGGLTPECVQYGASYRDYANRPSAKTLKDVFGNAKTILQGRVVELVPGFYEGEPSTLLTVVVEQVLRPIGDLREGSTVYVPYPYARFQIGSVRFCKQDSSFPHRPAVGEGLIISPFLNPIDDAGRLFLIQEQEWIFEDNTGKAIFPKVYRGAAEAEGLNSLAEVIRGKIKRKPSPERH